MTSRFSVLLTGLGLVLLGSTAAVAGGGGCATCYRQVVTPAMYGSVAETVMVRAPRTVAHMIPGEYGSVAEQVMVAPPRKVWQVTRNAYGEAVGCWVVQPAQYAVRHHHVLVRRPQVAHETVAAAYATRHRSVLVQPASSSWQPIGQGYGGHGGYVGRAGFGVGHGFHHGRGFGVGGYGGVQGVAFSATSTPFSY